MPELTAAEEKQLRSRKALADQGYAGWTNENMLDVLDTLDAERARVEALERGLRGMLWPDGRYSLEELCLILKNKLSQAAALLPKEEEKDGRIDRRQAS